MSEAIVQTLLGVALVLYPLAVYFGLKTGVHAWLGVGLIGIGILRLWFAGRRIGQVTPNTMIALVAMCFGVAVLIVGSGDMLLYYPVVMNVGMLSIFAVSLIFPPSLIERFASIREPDLPPAAIRYCRRVTLVWCVFLAGNGAVAVWTVLAGDRHVWLFYNGFLSYVLMGVLFAGEYAVRSILHSRHRSA